MVRAKPSSTGRPAATDASPEGSSVDPRRTPWVRPMRTPPTGTTRSSGRLRSGPPSWLPRTAATGAIPRSSSSTRGTETSPACRIRSTPSRSSSTSGGIASQVLADVRVGHDADAHRGVGQRPIAWKPASTKMVSPVTLADSGEAR